MTKIYLVRHGTTEDNRKGIFQGTRDTELSELGKKQADFLAERFKDFKIDAVYSSPLKRALVTAEKIAAAHELIPIIDNRLKEQDCGFLQGKTGQENQKKYPEAIFNMTFRPAYFSAPGGETSREVYNRISEAINEIAKNNPEKNIVVVSHGFAIQMFLSYARGLPFEETQCEILDNASFCIFSYNQNGEITIESVNDNSHIPADMRFCVSETDFYKE